MRRREFITLLGGTASWPLAARAQQGHRVRRLGVLMGFAESDPEWQARVAALREALKELSWTDGSNIQINYRWAVSDHDRLGKGPAELLALAPDVIFACPHFAVKALHDRTRTIPIVAVQSGDLVEAGFAQSHARPGGSVTGFTSYEPTFNAKFLQLLKEIAPNVTRVGVMQSQSSSWRGDFAAVQAAAPSLKVEAVTTIVRDGGDIERAMAALANKPNGALIVPPDAVTIRHRELLVRLAAEHRLPVVYALREFIAVGGLMYYGADFSDMFRRAASYVDRILRGERPGELPVQLPTRFEMTINLKTAKALGLEIPPVLLARADEVIE
jgi:putative tryptophan/tyrosine transport system substrate-binding protein